DQLARLALVGLRAIDDRQVGRALAVVELEALVGDVDDLIGLALGIEQLGQVAGVAAGHALHGHAVAADLNLAELDDGLALDDDAARHAAEEILAAEVLHGDFHLDVAVGQLVDALNLERTAVLRLGGLAGGLEDVVDRDEGFGVREGFGVEAAGQLLERFRILLAAFETNGDEALRAGHPLGRWAADDHHIAAHGSAAQCGVWVSLAPVRIHGDHQ